MLLLFNPVFSVLFYNFSVKYFIVQFIAFECTFINELQTYY